MTTILTPRELEVLRLYAMGYDNADIAKMTGAASRASVKVTAGRIRKKLNLPDRLDIVSFALEHKLICPYCSDPPFSPEIAFRTYMENQEEDGVRKFAPSSLIPVGMPHGSQRRYPPCTRYRSHSFSYKGRCACGFVRE